MDYIKREMERKFLAMNDVFKAITEMCSGIEIEAEEEEIDLKSLTAEMKNTDRAIREGNALLRSMLSDLTFCSAETEEAAPEAAE